MSPIIKRINLVSYLSIARWIVVKRVDALSKDSEMESPTWFFNLVIFRLGNNEIFCFFYFVFLQGNVQIISFLQIGFHTKTCIIMRAIRKALEFEGSRFKRGT